MIELTTFGGNALVRVDGDLTEPVTAGLRDALAWAIAHHDSVVVDLAGAPSIDSAGLGLLVRAHRRARRRGGMVCLVAPSRFVLTVLHTMHVDGVFPIFTDCASAETWLRYGDRAQAPDTVPALAAGWS